jgi:16S rRNA (uracil1498-N3)-methyltransferase
LSENQTHYLKNVMRRNAGDFIRIFDGQNGEYLARIETLTKKSCEVLPLENLKPQPAQAHRTHLIFAPLVKNRMDILIEKTVELGVTDLHPVLTNRTEHRKINEDRLLSQIIEASEQSERLDIPALHPLISMETLLGQWKDKPQIQWGCERDALERKPLGYNNENHQAFLIGPVGGFDEDEITLLGRHPAITPISLGSAILRAETASILCIGSTKINAI